MFLIQNVAHTMCSINVSCQMFKGKKLYPVLHKISWRIENRECLPNNYGGHYNLNTNLTRTFIKKNYRLISLMKTSSKIKYVCNIIRRKKITRLSRAQRLYFEPQIGGMV